jgi:DNA-binding MarR family transcriptional regulator
MSDLKPTEALFGQCSAYKSRQLARKVNALYDAQLAECGLKMTQFALLGFVGRFGPLKPGELAMHMELSASTLSRNVQPLIAQGWLVISVGADSRSRLVTLTPSGFDLCKRAYKCWQAAQTEMVQLLGSAQISTLHGLIDSFLPKISSKKNLKQEISSS